MKEVIILILLLILIQTFVLLYCQNTTKNCNCKQTENYTPPLKTDCYSKSETGGLYQDIAGRYNSKGAIDHNCYCNQPHDNVDQTNPNTIVCYDSKL
jgi:hypothetical protein